MLPDHRTLVVLSLASAIISSKFCLPSGNNIVELERKGDVFLEKQAQPDDYSIQMPIVMCSYLNIQSPPPLFPHELLFAPTYVRKWRWQDFELLYPYFQTLLNNSKLGLIESEMSGITKRLQWAGLESEKPKLQEKLDELKTRMEKSWTIQDIFRGARGKQSVLDMPIKLANYEVYFEKHQCLHRFDLHR